MTTSLQNGFKQAIAGGGTQIGLWLALADPYVAELCATAGFDWLLIDAEHGPNNLRSVLAQLQAVAPYPSQAIVRLPCGADHLIKQYLDIGAQTLLVPMVDTADQAAAIVAATRYPPVGRRGVGSGLARASRFAALNDYVHRAADDLCVIVQIESVESVRSIEAIASVAGVDGLFVGPSDLAASMGHLGSPQHPDVQAMVEQAIGRIRSMGKPAGVLATTEETARHFLDIGATFVAVGTDVGLLASSTRKLAQTYRAAGVDQVI